MDKTKYGLTDQELQESVETLKETRTLKCPFCEHDEFHSLEQNFSSMAGAAIRREGYRCKQCGAAFYVEFTANLISVVQNPPLSEKELAHVRHLADYNEHLVHVVGVDTADVANFSFNGVTIHNPFMDENEEKEVDPVEYYKEAFLTSQFLRQFDWQATDLARSKEKSQQ